MLLGEPEVRLRHRPRMAGPQTERVARLVFSAVHADLPPRHLELFFFAARLDREHFLRRICSLAATWVLRVLLSVVLQAEHFAVLEHRVDQVAHCVVWRLAGGRVAQPPAQPMSLLKRAADAGIFEHTFGLDDDAQLRLGSRFEQLGLVFAGVVDFWLLLATLEVAEVESWRLRLCLLGPGLVQNDRQQTGVRLLLSLGQHAVLQVDRRVLGLGLG